MKLNDLHSRIADLQLRIGDLAQSSLDPRDALMVAMEELSTALEELDVAQEELCQQDENLQTAYLKIESEHRRYLELFDFAPDCYLVTDLKGIIKEANIAATELLQSRLLGRNVSELLGYGDIDEFKSNLPRLKDGAIIRNWEARVMPHGDAAIPVLISANATHDLSGNPDGLRWLLHDITKRKIAEKTLQESEKKYRLLIENANEAIVVAQDGVLKFANPKFLEITGRSKEELISKQFSELIHPDDREMVVENYIMRMKGIEAPERYSFKIIDKTGNIKWLEINPVKISWMGRPATLNFLSDITERQIAEDRLRLFQSIVANANEGVIVMVMPGPSCRGLPIIDYVNHAFEKMTGYGEEDLVGRPPMILDGPDTNPPYAKKILESISRKEPLRLDKISYRKDGTPFWSELSAFPLLNELGQIDYWVSINHDTTERHRYEEELSASREMYRDLVENINEAIYSIDDKGVITYISPAAERIAGYSPEEIIGRRFEDLLTIEDKGALKELFIKILSGDAYESRSLRILTKSGEVKWIHNSSRPAYKDGHIIGIRGVLTDITERKNAEKALRESLEFLQRLIDNIPSPIFYKGTDSLFLGCNKAFEDLMGKKREDILGKSVYDMVPEDMADKHHEVDAALITGPGTQVYEAPVQDADGISRDFLINKATYADADGDVAGIVAVLMEITDRKKAEHATKEREAELAAIYDNAPMVMMLVDSERRVRKTNKFAEQFAGSTSEEMLGLRGGNALGCLYALDDPQGCGFGPECHECTMRKTVLDTIETGRSHHQVEASRPFSVAGKAQDITFLISTSRLDIRGESQVLVTIQDITDRKHVEFALKESERRLASIIDFLPDSTFVVDRDGKAIAWNRATEAMTGVKAEDILGKGNYEYALPFYGERRALLIDLVLRPDEEYQEKYAGIEIRDGTLVGEAYIPSLKGKRIYFSGRAAALYDSIGNIVGAIESIRDITDRKLMEEALQKSNDFLDRIINSIGDPIFVKDRWHRLVMLNDAACRLFGRSREEIIGKTDYDFFPKEQVDVFWKMDEEVFENGLENVNEEEITDSEGCVHSIITKKTLYKSPSGEDFIVGAIRDITDRKLMERALQESKDFLEKIINAIGDPIFVKDRRHKLVLANDAACNYFDCSRDEILGKTAYDLFPDREMADVSWEKDEEVFKSGKEVVNEETNAYAHGMTRTVLVKKTPYYDNAGNQLLVGITRDITERKRAENALKESERRLSDIIDFLPDATIVIDKDGRVIAWNRAVEAITGVKAEDILGKGNYEYALPFYGERTPVLIDLVLRPDEELRGRYTGIEVRDGALHGEIYIPSLRGKKTYFLGTAAALYDSKGSIVGAIESIRDITERKRAEEDLRRSREKYHNIFENSILGLYQSTPGGRYLSVNRAFSRLFGYSSPEEMIESVTDISHQLYVNLQDRDRAIKQIAEQGFLEGFEIEARRRDGTTLWISMSTRTVQDENGMHFDGSVEDITNRKLVEDALGKSERRYRAIFENTGTAMAIIEDNTIISFANAEFEKLVGYTKEEIEGKKSWTEFIVKDDLERMIEQHNKRRSEPSASEKSYEFRFMDRDGRVRNAVLTITMIPGGSQSIASILDITEKKKNEEMLAASLQEKDILLKEIHHRVKNNLQIIASLLNIQSYYTQDERITEVLKECHNRVRSMALIHESLYKSENLAKVNFAEYISKLTISLFSSFGVDKSKIKLLFDLDDVFLSIDKAIPCGLIVNELVSNCLKHAFPGDNEGEVKIELKSLGTDNILLVVKDDGVGLPESFEPQKTQTMGLKLVTDLVKQLKGNSQFASVEGIDIEIIFPA